MAYLRDLLMLHGVLPPADRQLMLFQQWLGDILAEIDQPENRQIVERFAAWHVQHRLRRFADQGPVTAQQTQQARAEIRLAIAFLAWLGDQGRGLSSCGQADIDAVKFPAAKRHVINFALGLRVVVEAVPVWLYHH